MSRITTLLLAATIGVPLFISTCNRGKYQCEQLRGDVGAWRADSCKAIGANVRRAVAIMNQITRASQYAKALTGVGAMRASQDIKAAVAVMIELPVPAYGLDAVQPGQNGYSKH